MDVCVCVCASEKCVFYTDLPYLDLTFETPSPVPSFYKFMAVCYAIPFTPGLIGVNAGDGSNCSAFAGHWDKLGSNKTFHAGQEPVPFFRLQFA